MSPAEIGSAFVTVFLAELPDKTMVATIVLVARYRQAVSVWIGATAAFAVHVTVAVVAGSAVSRLPERIVGVAVVLLFSGGAVAMFVAARRTDGLEQEPPPEHGPTSPTRRTTLRAIAGSFAFVAVAEWGDLTQIATAGLAARGDSALSVWVGALAALATVAGIAASVGQQLIERIPVQKIQLTAAGVFAALAVWSIVDLVNTG